MGAHTTPSPVLRVNGKPLHESTKATQADKLLTFLKSGTDGDVFTTDFLADKFGISKNSINAASHTPQLKPYIYAQGPGRRMYFGTPQALRNLAAALAKEEGQE